MKKVVNDKEIKIVTKEEDPGISFKLLVDTDKGQIERYYVDANIHMEELQRRVLASANAPARAATLTHRRNKKIPDAGLRIGYAFWGFLGDNKLDDDGNRLSTPDGNATYSWSIVWEALRRGHRVIPMMIDRDNPGCNEFGFKNFRAFAQQFRTSAYKHLVENGELFNSYQGFPELDVLLLEWRFPIPGRNTPDCEKNAGWHPDLKRQEQLLSFYSKKKTKIIVWDLDYKLTKEDEKKWKIDAILETSVSPKKLHLERTRVEPPMFMQALRDCKIIKPVHLLAYVGSRYERDEVVDEWIRPIANRDVARSKIYFYGNWVKDADIYTRWPGINFRDRITTVDFEKSISCAAGVPLLAKQEYRDRGFMTPRIWEALMFGSIPIGLAGHTGITSYTDTVASDAEDLLRISQELLDMSLQDRTKLHDKAIEKIRFMDAKFFIDTIEKLSI